MNRDAECRLRARSLTIGYPIKSQNDRLVASDLNLVLRPGEFVCLLGPNGVGKSTLIRALSGMEKPLLGSIEIYDTDIDLLSPRERAREVSVVLTESSPAGLFTARSIVALGRHPHTSWTGGLSDKDHERIEWAITAVGAEKLADRHVSELSDGERQKIMVARALAQEASIMLLDEPTAYLDLPRRVELMRTLRDLTIREGLSVLLSTHDLDLALRCADSLWLMGEDGTVSTGVPEDMALQGQLESVFASDSLDWDEEHGTFRLHREPCSAVILEGEGTAYIWTRRALARIGYGVVEASNHDAALRIQIRSEDGKTIWLLNDQIFESLEDLIKPLLPDDAHER